jgi:N-acetylmuramoyl-L-alanine amidase
MIPIHRFILAITLTGITVSLPCRSLFAAERPPQPPPVAAILARETNIAYVNELTDLVYRIDDTYTGLYDTLRAGGKLIVFFDPAHGKWANGLWEGEITGRTSCTGLPEEQYSIPLSRELYRLCEANRFMDVQSTPDFMEVLRGKSDSYNNIPFTETVRMAGEAGAFIIVSEHLNNIASVMKASGVLNMPGIHITTNRWGVRYLSYIKDTNKGFLTLYNKLDTTDFSRQYALNLKEILSSRGMRPNSWERGAVPDARFPYFVDFPISVIYESGFISNPEDEAMLRAPENQRTIAESQYEALLETTKDVFGLDLSGREPRKVKNPPEDLYTLLKLSRIAIFYVDKTEINKAVAVIDLMEKGFGRSYPSSMPVYRSIKGTLTQAERHFTLSRKMIRNKNYKGATRHIYLARRLLRNRPIFSSLHTRYSSEYAQLGVPAREGPVQVQQRKESPVAGSPPAVAMNAYRSSLTTPIILAVDQDQNLEAAVLKALNPGKETTAKLLKSLSGARMWSRVRSGTIKGGRVRFYWKKSLVRVTFTPGIYIVSLNRNLSVASVARVGKVRLDPRRYQNHQYLKNSYFALEDKHRSL